MGDLKDVKSIPDGMELLKDMDLSEALGVLENTQVSGNAVAATIQAGLEELKSAPWWLDFTEKERAQPLKEVLNLMCKAYKTAPLIFAAWKGQDKLLEVLLETPWVDVNTQVLGNGNTALHMACLWKRFTAVQLLLKANVPVNPKNAYGQTPLDFLDKKEEKTIFKLLKAHGAKKGRKI